VCVCPHTVRAIPAGSGYITRKNFKELLGDEWTSARVDQIMVEADTKRDGRIGLYAVISTSNLFDDALYVAALPFRLRRL
jgi:hypothetical protein